MSLSYIRDYYGVPAKNRGRVAYAGTADGSIKQGTIIGASGAHLRVLFDGESRVSYLHPTWMIRYLRNDGADGGEHWTDPL